ncbi:hypothetical protein [Companilactobacillus hulinensis]|uniref:hypothetical protein n=1 Tax=Companilactobacillus hulinensis TaxID=2486007 RepID=UPI000F780560|nr:hypothetical protein [Companilactobacillus hulinensis]
MSKRVIYDWTTGAIKELMDAQDRGETALTIVQSMDMDEYRYPEMLDVLLNCADENLFVKDIADYFCYSADFEVKDDE